ncbi:aromatic/alkene/methane monooxygenase hydroxylase/oxygenase subunit alpha [Acidocella sp. KAb 2-4]|uniref:aromatic/alkene/methane monooxygenase hydroxylase/oxygenase subunit alpha n=1 Tax=Acidocella sp. KAb 2-4 TaxID=2885158 RepID=UPI001D08B419|nr:aromatic/alkene/methane monooxygenase hydroxylase/oxygenase subunit alpha [Acidocella sp. KAb 2-4]MCB5945620.1 aromatic/alkene/methane monooxygenase hydroxylase/oxygenase subunit alpha [Acidocella sp. KAb 2-4]
MTAKKLSLKQRYEFLTRDLDWEPSYQSADDIYPYDKFEGIKIKDWSGWEDPFRLTMDSYWKFQAEKERKLYAVIDAFAQNNGQTGVSDGRYINVLKVFLTGISPEEYQAHRGFAFTGRHLRGAGTRVACQMQSLDELRHVQTQIHTISHYNKYFDGMSEFPIQHDRVFYLSVPKSFFDDARTAGPFEFMVAVGFAFEYVLTNLLFVPFMSGAAYNGDMSTVTFGFSAQSDESRHMTLGIEVIKFLLEQHPDNLPIVQRWVDKWFWRGFRLLGIVAAMMDYMLPKKVMSWKEAWDIYFVEAGGALFQDLARYGLKMPKYADIATEAGEHISHQNWGLFYQLCHVAGFHAWMPDAEHLDWLSAKYPNTFDKYYRPRFEMWAKQEKEGKRFFFNGLPQLCSCCQLPMLYTEPGDPTKTCFRSSVFKGTRYHFCSDGCKDIFDGEPEKYVQSWLPVNQIFQGNCGGATVPEVLDWYKINVGVDNGDYVGSPDEALWNAWTAQRFSEAS